MKPIEKFIGTALKEAEQYPVHLLIAVKLIDAGYSEADFNRGEFPRIGDPIKINVANSMRDVLLGRVKLTSRLLELARHF